MSSISVSRGTQYTESGSSPFFSRPVNTGSLSDEYAFYFNTDHDPDGIPTLVNVTTGATFTRNYLNGTDFAYSLGFHDHTGKLTLNGSANGDIILGGSNSDRLLGDNGNDYIDGGRGADRMEGGNGHDTFVVDTIRDVVLEARGAGYDKVETSVNYALTAGQEIEVLNARSAKGLVLTGNEFGQIIDADAGNDLLTGAGGADTLVGGLGADTFSYKTLSDSKVWVAGRDTIRDFSESQGDRIDLRGIDAKTCGCADGDQAFTFLGNRAFTFEAGQLQTRYVGNDTLVNGDVDGNGRADFSILLKGHQVLDSGDFLL